MLRVDHYLFLPGCCWSCRSVNLPTIDTGIDLDGVNSPDDPNPSSVTRIYFCADCAIEMARMVTDSRGLEIVAEGSNRVLAEMVQSLSDQNIASTERIAELENALRVVKSIQPPPEAEPAAKTFKVETPKAGKK